MFVYFLFTSRKLSMVFLLALLLLSGCGQSPSSSTQTPQKTLASTHSSGTTLAATPSPAPLGTGVAFDLGGWLHIQSAGGFSCGFATNGVPITPGILVLPKVLPSYDQGTLQSVQNYLNAASRSDALLVDTVPYPIFPVSSNAFQLAAVDVVSNSNMSGACGETLHITNIGNAPVQISQVSARLVLDTQTNNQHYNLVALCSIASNSICFPHGGGEAGYLADFNLGAGKANTTIPTTSWGLATRSAPSSSSQTLSLKPGEVAKVYISYSTTSNLSFSLMPTFTLDWPGKQQIFAAPQLQASFAFAQASQFSCYALQGQQFVQVPVDYEHYCM